MLVMSVAACAPAAAGPPSDTVTVFTRQVQPLLLNKCAMGACHGGPDAGDLRLIRGDVAGRIDRAITLANMNAILRACGPQRDPATLLTTISGRHPASATAPHRLSQPLSPRERAVLEDWLTSALTTHTFAGANATPPPKPANRLQKLLDTAANPPALPPPEEPQGLLLK